MNNNLLEILYTGFDEFYNRCSSVYNIGNRELYSAEVLKVKNKYCFNIFIATECDVQVKLGGIIEELFRNRDIPYTVNAEMKIYDLPGRNQRADLTIHKLPNDHLYLKHRAPIDSLTAAFEIKYANAVHPYSEFANGAVQRDIDKLASLNDGVLKFLVVIDEAMKISGDLVSEIVRDCRNKKIAVVSNNPSLRSSMQFG